MVVERGSGENIFIVLNGRLLTPPASSSILSGITRDTVITLAAEIGIETRETTISREQLYAADEIFMTGVRRNPNSQGIITVSSRTFRRVDRASW